MIRKIHIIFSMLITCLVLGISLNAQQQPLYTQFMYQKSAFNPGYAGSLEATAATFLHRSQWIGLDGAPSVQSLSVHGPLKNQNIGLGGYITNTSIGITNYITLAGVYAYKLPIGDSKLSLGLAPSIRHYSIDFSDDRLQATEGIGIDNALNDGNESKFLANIGVGAYFSNEKLFIGVSVPRIAESDIDFDDVEDFQAREYRHFYFMGGYSFDLSDQFRLTPQTMVKVTDGAPTDFDINAMITYREDYSLGVTYRHYHGTRDALAESLDVLLGIQIAQPFFMGLSYDIGLNELSNYHKGSIEIAVRYLFIKPEKKMEFDNPRYF